MALQMQRALPLKARDAYLIIEMGVRPTLTELETMPQELIDTMLLYGAVKATIECGGELTL